jgi:hypothetical protein
LRSRDRCYDFLNIFAKKFSEKNWRFWFKAKLNFEKKIDHNIVFREKRHFLRKLGKIAENCDHNIDPWNNSCAAGCENSSAKKCAAQNI